MDMETFQEPEITCPYCKEAISDSWEYHLDQDESTNIECSCGKTYVATCCWEVSYSSRAECELNDEDHVFKREDIHTQNLGTDDALACVRCCNCSEQIFIELLKDNSNYKRYANDKVKDVHSEKYIKLIDKD